MAQLIGLPGPAGVHLVGAHLRPVAHRGAQPRGGSFATRELAQAGLSIAS